VFCWAYILALSRSAIKSPSVNSEHVTHTLHNDDGDNENNNNNNKLIINYLLIWKIHSSIYSTTKTLEKRMYNMKLKDTKAGH